MVRPTFVTPGEVKEKITLRTIALGVIVVAAIVLMLGFGLQRPGSPLNTLVGKVGRAVGLEIGDQGIGGATSGESQDSSLPITPVPGKESILAATSADEILHLLNDWRVSQNLPTIVKNDRFCEFANVRAKDVSQNWSQQTIIENKDYYFRAVCLKCKNMAEVLAREVTNPTQLIENWLKNPQTKATLSRPYNIGCVGGYSPDQIHAFIALEMGEKVTE